MFTHEMNDPIRLRKSLMRAKRTLEAGVIVGMSGRNMNGESLRMEKLLLTGGTLKREMALVGLHVIMHGVLILLRDLADGTYKLSRGILLIGIGHWLRGQVANGCINFSKGGLLPSLLAMAIMTTATIGLF